MLLYPLKTTAYYKEMPWGGSGLNIEYNKKSSFEFTGESWEAADHANGRTCVENGDYAGESLNMLAQKFGKDFLGFEGKHFPVLFKLIDARERLSVQVHPNDTYAAAYGDGGKTEMWIVLKAEPGAGLYLGFKNPLTPDNYEKLIRDGGLEEALNFIPACPGDTYFLPAGLVHAVGAGLIIAEIQQSSDATYRVYDWGRVGLDGKPRSLHIEQALQVSDIRLRGEKGGSVVIEHTENGEDLKAYLTACPYFAAARICANGKTRQDTHGSSFHILFIESGNAHISALDGAASAQKGDTVILPAASGKYHLDGDFCALLFWVPNIERDYTQKLTALGVPKNEIDKLLKKA